VCGCVCVCVCVCVCIHSYSSKNIILHICTYTVHSCVYGIRTLMRRDFAKAQGRLKPPEVWYCKVDKKSIESLCGRDCTPSHLYLIFLTNAICRWAGLSGFRSSVRLVISCELIPIPCVFIALTENMNLL
jgi:hypothetical protein